MIVKFTSGWRSRLVLSLALFSVFVPLDAQAQEQLLRTLTVTGTGVEKISTTLTQVNLGVEIQSETATQAQQEIAKRTTALVALLRSRNVEQLQTTGISLSPRYNNRGGESVLIGYIGSNTVSFRVATERAGDIIDDAVRTGATRINGVSFTAEENTIEAARQQALVKATQNAREQADIVLDALNLSPQEVVGVQIGQAASPILTRGNILFGREEAQAESPVIGGEQTVSASVTLQIRY
ncbi:SIMPL domain-containing protein [Spirulina sp. 06S082]|uniref:SIMPL domain-containing protein n=1 Tax=Spirulina sp. 06S082 TaxID=3110248 RepID=UPI002B21810E|nr:SIMPL domain-containing protein [Spirulina sp. 06S082]MEA5469363.1 SIMPL domain-containing protein [Spirulina sp. 06S082]